MNEQRIAIATKLLAGFAANPAIFAPNGTCGWSLVNCTDEDVCGYALHLADKLITGEKVICELQEKERIKREGTPF